MINSITLSLSGSSSFSIVDAGCTSLAPGAMCSGLVRFLPTADGTVTAALAADGGLAGIAVLNMVARGFEAGRLQWIEDGGSVWPSTNLDVTHTLTVKNISTGAALPLTITLTDAGTSWRLEPDAGAGQCLNGSTALAPGGTCTARVTFLAASSPTPDGLSTAQLRASASGSPTVVSALRATATYSFVFAPYEVSASLTTTMLQSGAPGGFCPSNTDFILQFVADAPTGTQLEYKHQPALDASRCTSPNFFYEIPARDAGVLWPGTIRECGGGMSSWMSAEGSQPGIGQGNSFCLPSSTTGQVWGSDVLGSGVGACRTNLTVIGQRWQCK